MDGERLSCKWVRARMDPYMDRETGNETTAMDEHLNGCAACGEVLANRRNLRARVRCAAVYVVVPADLSARIRTKLDGEARGWHWNHSLLAVAAALILAVGGYELNKTPRLDSEEALLGRLSALTSPILRVGLQDHIHCAMFQKYPAQGPTLEQLTTQLGADFRGLVQIVQAHVPNGLRVIEAHHCTFGERRYIHVVARQGEQLLSLVITLRSPGEAFENDLKTVISEAGVNLYTAGHGDFQIAGFETGPYLVYLISNTSQPKNLAVMRAMTPALREVFRKIEI